MSLKTKIKNKFLKKKKIFNRVQLDNLLKRMNEGSFEFSDLEIEKMKKQWHVSKEHCPLPKRLEEIFDSNDAFLMNSSEAAELTFKLPYGIAYEEAQSDSYHSIVNCIKENNISLEKSKIIDVGCGFGGLLSCVKKIAPSCDLIGIECVSSAEKMLNKRFPWIRFEQKNIDIDPEVFHSDLIGDVVLCTEVLEHLVNPDYAIKNLLSMKAKGGHLIITIPNGRYDRASQHINFWSPESWKVFLSKYSSGQKVKIMKHYNVFSPGQYNILSIISDF